MKNIIKFADPKKHNEPIDPEAETFFDALFEAKEAQLKLLDAMLAMGIEENSKTHQVFELGVYNLKALEDTIGHFFPDQAKKNQSVEQEEGHDFGLSHDIIENILDEGGDDALPTVYDLFVDSIHVLKNYNWSDALLKTALDDHLEIWHNNNKKKKGSLIA
jgi:hypothetical protein